MVFIIKKIISFQVMMEEVLSGRVPGALRDQAVADQHPPSVGVGYKDSVPAGIEKYGVHGF